MTGTAMPEGDSSTIHTVSSQFRHKNMCSRGIQTSCFL